MDDYLAPFIKAAQTKRPTRRTKGQEGAGSDGMVLSIFDIPPGLLTLTKDKQSHDRTVPSSLAYTETGPQIVHPENYKGVGSTSNTQEKARELTCIRCGLQFGHDRPSQVKHFKSDLHMANLRRYLAGKPRISQQQLDLEDAAAAIAGDSDKHDKGVARTDDDGESSSGSESDETLIGATNHGVHLEDVPEEDGENARGELLAAAVDVCDRTNSRTNKRGRVRVDFSLQGGPRLTFVPRDSDWAFSVSSAALGMERGDDPWARLDCLFGDNGGVNRLWAVVILRSGKFAAAIFEGQRALCHKVFRRYTIRAKRGGSQSSHDSGGRKAQSAGAALRRYGEQALREDVRALLKEWEEPLKACRVVLTSVPKAMRTVLFDGKDAPFDRKDPRLRLVPFAVGKPVFEEVVAVHSRVTSIVFWDSAAVPDEDPRPAGNTNNREKSKSDDSKDRKNVKETVASDVEGQAVAQQYVGGLIPPAGEFIEACERGDMDSAVALLERLELNVDAAAAVYEHAPSNGGVSIVAPGATATGWTPQEVLDHPDGIERLMTPLHVAAAGGHAAVVGMLLQRGANPQTQDVRGRVPYVLASNKDTRDAFRRARAGLPERWDWDAARVPEPLTEELQQRQKEKLKEKEKEKKRRAKLRKKADKERAAEEARQQKEKEDAEAEDRRKRGLAAAGHCDACGKALVAKKAFSRFEFRYCSSDCASLHKRKLAADAAERRFNGR